MIEPPMTAMLRRPSAWLPMLLSVAAIGLVVAHVVLVGVAPQEDEGTEARIFQLLILVDAVAIGAFAVRWLPLAPRAALMVLGLQILLAAIPLVTIAALEW